MSARTDSIDVCVARAAAAIQRRLPALMIVCPTCKAGVARGCIAQPSPPAAPAAPVPRRAAEKFPPRPLRSSIVTTARAFSREHPGDPAVAVIAELLVLVAHCQALLEDRAALPTPAAEGRARRAG